VLLELSVLGPVELRLAGSQVELGPARQRCVVAALAVDAGRPVAIDELIERVWGVDAPAGARSGVYSYLTRLRQGLARAAVPDTALRVASRAGGYELVVDAARVDVHRFRRLIRAVWSGAASDECLAELIDQAVWRWRGPALAGLSGEWADRTRQLLEQERVDAVVLWAGTQLERGRTGPVVGTLRGLVDEHPLVEPLAARLIEALGRDGRTAEALDWYAMTRRRLIEALGTEPGTDLRRMHQAVLAGELSSA
jgi:DNA-binding SARP family transcriptional activator